MKPIVVLACLTLACGGGSPQPETADNAAAAHGSAPGAPAETTPVPQTFAEQVTLGQKLYGEQCASCHGDAGEGKTAPRVVGLDQGALPLAPPATAQYRKTEFKTVADVADFVVKSMPPKAPGSLSEEQYFAILAFDLKANGIDLGDKKLDGALAQTLEIPRK
ncbi:MAG TPA: c-type cytochrome [Polyangiaceae bacterium]|nr:c-type cytochrome [Polyangiaceae bacterium]